MSTAFRTDGNKIRFEDLKFHAPNLGIEVSNNGHGGLCLSLNGNHVHASTGDGSDTGFEKFGGNSSEEILNLLAEHFDTNFLSEHDEGYFNDDE